MRLKNKSAFQREPWPRQQQQIVSYNNHASINLTATPRVYQGILQDSLCLTDVYLTAGALPNNSIHTSCELLTQEQMLAC